MSEDIYTQRVKDGKEFFCPVGHKQYFSQREDTIMELKKKIRDLQVRLESMPDANFYKTHYNLELMEHGRTKRRYYAAKATITRLKNKMK